MAGSSISVSKIASRLKMQTYKHNPDGTSALITSPDAGSTLRLWELTAIGGFEAFLAMGNMHSVAGGCTKIEIVGCSASDGSDATVIKELTVAADAEDDFFMLEVTAAEVRKYADDASVVVDYIGARFTCSDATDEIAVTYVMMGAGFQYDGLTANAIA